MKNELILLIDHQLPLGCIFKAFVNNITQNTHLTAKQCKHYGLYLEWVFITLAFVSPYLWCVFSLPKENCHQDWEKEKAKASVFRGGVR